MIDEDPRSLLDRFTALPAAASLLPRLADSPEDVYLVGGAVRDLMLGGAPADLDLVVTGALEPLAERLGAPLRRYDRFGTGSLQIEDFAFDLARARSETYDRPGALPTVAPAGLEADLERRDFTVNAMALGLFGPQRGRLIAHPAALDDLRNRRLRVLHDGSFSDDPTRLLRLARYRARLGFDIEAHTAGLLESALRAGVLDTVTGSRLGAELRQMAREDDPVRPFRVMTELGLGEALAPGFSLAVPAVAERALALLPNDGDRATVVLGAALQSVPNPADLLERLAFPAEERDRILDAAGAGVLADRLQAVGSGPPSAIAAAVAGAGPEAVALAGALGPVEAAGQWLESLRKVRLQIGGEDLLAAGIPRGPGIGRGLAAALTAKLDGLADDRQAELAVALAAATGEPTEIRRATH